MNNSRVNAIVYCEGAFNTPNGKTAHGLVRFTRRYRVMAVIDSRYAGKDAGQVLDGSSCDIPIVASLQEAIELCRGSATQFVFGLAPDGGRLSGPARVHVIEAIAAGLDVVAGLHDFLTEDEEMLSLAREHGVTLTDVRKPPARNELHFFSGDIEKVDSFRIAVLGTDSAVGKRTTAWKLVEGLERGGHTCEMVGTGQTAWLQGARFSVVIDSIVSDFVAGELEHAVYRAWSEERPDAIVIEGQGSLMNPAYPGGFEIIGAARPDVIVLQHAPARKDYDGFPGYPIHPLPRQIEALEIVSGKPVVAIAVNHEGIPKQELHWVCTTIERTLGLPCVDVLLDGPMRIVKAIQARMAQRRKDSGAS